MTCPKCEHQQIKRFGKYGKTAIQRYRCKECGATFAEPNRAHQPINGHTTNFVRVVQVFTLLTEGMSVRAISRVTGVHKTTILSLLNTIGNRCAALLDAKIQNLRPRYVQAERHGRSFTRSKSGSPRCRLKSGAISTYGLRSTAKQSSSCRIASASVTLRTRTSLSET